MQKSEMYYERIKEKNPDGTIAKLTDLLNEMKYDSTGKLDEHDVMRHLIALTTLIREVV